MERISRILTAVMLGIFALLFGLALLLGGCQPEHLSYCVAFALGLAGAAIYALWQRRPRLGPTLWERLGRGRTELFLLCLCFLLNLAWVLYFRLEPTVDYATFWHAAVQLAAGEPIANRVYIALFPHILGYSSFLSLFLRVFGTGSLVAPVVNVCLTTLSGVFLYHLTLRWRGENSAALVLLLWSLFPSKLFYNTMVLSEPYYTCLLLAALWLMAEVEARRPKLLTAALLGLLAGLLLRLMNTARPIAAVPILALLIWLVFLRGERGRAERISWLGFTGVLLAAYLLTGPLWNAYAERVLGETPATVPGYSFYVGINPDSLGSYSNEDMERLQTLRGPADGGSAVEAQQQILEEAKARLHSGEIPFGKLLFTKLRNFLGYDEGGAFYSRARLRDRSYQVLALYSNIWYYALGLLALWGAWRVYRAGVRSTALLAPLYVIGLTLAQLLVEVSARYHYSIVPMLILLAAFSYTRPRKREEA